MFVSKKEYKREVDLLFWNEHYALITNFSAFLRDLTNCRNKIWFCKSCFGHHFSEEALANHKLFCKTINWCNQILFLPDPETFTKFKNIKYQQACPFVIYADFECLTTPFDKKKHNTTQYQHHVPCSIGYKIISRVQGLKIDTTLKVHTGEDSVEWFLEQLEREEQILIKALAQFEEMHLTDANKADYLKADKCYLCFKPFGTKQLKVRDHNHLTGEYRGAAHTSCNLQLSTQYKIPVFFHNFRGYDSHLLVWGLAKYPNSKLSVIGQGVEKYLLVEWGPHYQFKDSLQFLPASLERLVENLKTCDVEKFVNLKAHFTNATPQQIQLLKQKGIYPYDWMNSMEKMNERLLPPQESFNSILRNEACSDEDYKRAKEVWETFHFQTFKEYHEHYLACMIAMHF